MGDHGRLCERPFAHASERPYPVSKFTCGGHVGHDRAFMQIARKVLASFHE